MIPDVMNAVTSREFRFMDAILRGYARFRLKENLIRELSRQRMQALKASSTLMWMNCHWSDWTHSKAICISELRFGWKQKGKKYEMPKRMSSSPNIGVISLGKHGM